jgi:hypothetical protein
MCLFKRTATITVAYSIFGVVGEPVGSEVGYAG